MGGEVDGVVGGRVSERRPDDERSEDAGRVAVRNDDGGNLWLLERGDRWTEPRRREIYAERRASITISSSEARIAPVVGRPSISRLVRGQRTPW